MHRVIHFSNTSENYHPSIFVHHQREKPVRSTSAMLQSYSRPRSIKLTLDVYARPPLPPSTP